MSGRPIQPEREDVRPDEREAFDYVLRRETSYGSNHLVGDVGPYFGALLQSPTIPYHLIQLGEFYRTRGDTEGSFSHAEREWTDMVIGHEIAPPIMYHHMLDAVAVGVRREAIVALYEGRDGDLEPGERQLADYVRSFLAGSVSQEESDALEERFGVRGAVEFTAWTGHLMMTARVVTALLPGLIDQVRPLLEARVQAVKDGTAEIPDARARIPKPLE